MTLTFDVPLPPRACAPRGSHGHWSTKAKARALYGQEVLADISRTVGLRSYRATQKSRVSLLFGIADGRRAKRYQPRDLDNAIAAFKGGLDAIVRAGLLVDDSRTWMELGEVRIDNTCGPWVRVTVEPVEVQG